MKKIKKIKPNYLIIPALVALVSAVGSVFTSSGMDWYKLINLPGWTPPGSVIGVVWTAIFILSAVSLLIIWNRVDYKSGRMHIHLIICVFVVNALLNVFWSFLFFNQHYIVFAIWDAGLLAVSVAVLVGLTWPISKIASLLLVPYMAWAAFATYLNYSIWLIN